MTTHTKPPPPGITYCDDSKWDLQLSDALIEERRLAEIFAYRKIGSVELKTETWLWEKYGNICIEYRAGGKPSGIAVTQCEYWAHQLRRDGATLCYLMFPIDRLKELARYWITHGGDRKGGGDGGRFDNVVIPLRAILR